MQVFSFIYVICLYSTYVNSNAIYNDRYNNDRSKSRYAVEEDQQQIVGGPDDPPSARDPPPMPYGMPFYYQRVPVPYAYGEYFRPRQRFVPAKQLFDPPSKRGEIYYRMDDPERRQCRSLGRRRSVSYAKQPFKLSPLKEESSFYASDLNSPSHSERVERNDLYHIGRQDDAERDESAAEEGPSNERFADEKYPAVLANFKIGTKLDKKSIAEPVKLLKREFRQNDSSLVKEKDTSASGFEESDTDGKVAEELRDILDYMGLIDEDNIPNAKAAIDKREESKKVAYEDENMEEGSNRISLTREERSSTSQDRSKREDKSSVATESSIPSSTATESEQKDKVAISRTKEPDRAKRESLAEKRESLTEKRQDDDNSTLTHSVHITSDPDESDVNSNANDYEKRVERQIQTRINALKEEVKREIAALKAQEAAQAVHTLNEDTQRKKRQAVTTLIDEENSDVDPALHPDVALKPHVRKRRKIEERDMLDNNSQITTYNSSIPVTSENSTLFIPNHSLNYSNKYTRNSRINDTKNYLANLDEILTPADSLISKEESRTLNGAHQIQNRNLGNQTSNYSFNTVHSEPAHGIAQIKTSRRRKREIDNEVSYIPARFASGYVASPGAAISYLPYSSKSDMVDEEEGEMDYDGYYDIVPNVQRKRQARYMTRRSVPYYHLHDFRNRLKRRRRQDTDAFHGGGPTENHRSLVRAIGLASRPRIRRRAYLKRDSKKSQQPQTLSDMSDTDIFGALPQSYDGELSRFKRVRRSRKKG